jgi:hypothetical protein
LFLILSVAVVAFGGGVVRREVETFGFYCCGELVAGYVLVVALRSGAWRVLGFSGKGLEED